MKAITQDLAIAVFDHLPKPIEEWWQPVCETDEVTQSRLHLARMHFTRVMMKIHARPGHGLYFQTHPAGHLHISIRRDREWTALSRLREVEPLQTTLPPEPVAADALRKEIFPYLPSDVSRYMYLTLLHEIDKPRFCYPALVPSFSKAKIHRAIVTLASRLVWKLCLIDEANLISLIRGCVKEMSGGSVEDFMQWCRSSVASDAPYLEMDQVLRRCFVPITSRMSFPPSK